MKSRKLPKINSEQRALGMLSHLLGFFTYFIGPLIIFLIYKEKKGFIYENARHSLNFQISMILYYILATIIIFGLFGILYYLLWVFALVVVILASVKSYQGEIYKYPLEIEFIKKLK